MSEVAQRDRSPAFPSIPLKEALDRLAQFDKHFQRSSARPEKVGEAWGIGTAAYASRIAAALRYYGLLDYQSQGGSRAIIVSDEGRKYLRAQQDSVKKDVIAGAALRPKQIAHFWKTWGPRRPVDAAALDELVFKNEFSERGARDFLKVYDATIAFAGLPESATIMPVNDGEVTADPARMEIEVGDLIQVEIDGAYALEKPTVVRAVEDHQGHRWVFIETSETGVPMEQAVLVEKGTADSKSLPAAPILPLPTKPPAGSPQISADPSEVEWIRGPIGHDMSYRIIVKGKMGAKEIGKLIRVLKAQQIALSDDDDDDDEAAD